MRADPHPHRAQGCRRVRPRFAAAHAKGRYAPKKRPSLCIVQREGRFWVPVGAISTFPSGFLVEATRPPRSCYPAHSRYFRAMSFCATFRCCSPHALALSRHIEKAAPFRICLRVWDGSVNLARPRFFRAMPFCTTFRCCSPHALALSRHIEKAAPFRVCLRVWDGSVTAMHHAAVNPAHSRYFQAMPFARHSASALGARARRYFR